MRGQTRVERADDRRTAARKETRCEMTYSAYCPNCDYRLTIRDEDHYVIILDNDHAVTACPNCLLELDVQGGELAEAA